MWVKLQGIMTSMNLKKKIEMKWGSEFCKRCREIANINIIDQEEKNS